MSSAALARKRRANGVSDSPPVIPQSQQSAQPKVGLTLPQVLSVIDARLKLLENPKSTKSETPTSDNTFSSEVQQEYEARFQMLATEIQELKDTILKLQTFTMEVNHTLFTERQFHTLEEVVVEEKEKSTFESIMETLQEGD
jgi:hypothetical protein